MAITTGEFFTNVLLAAAPTALGKALAHLPTNTAAWSAALTADIASGATKEDASLITEFLNRLVTYDQIYTALLTPVYVPNGSGGYAPVPLAKALNDQIAQLGNTSLLTVPWAQPPHPPGRYVWRLIDTLSGYDEQ